VMSATHNPRMNQQMSRAGVEARDSHARGPGASGPQAQEEKVADSSNRKYRRARGSAAPSPVRRTWRTGLRQADRSRWRLAAHSAAYRRDARAILAAPPTPPQRPLLTLSSSHRHPPHCSTAIHSGDPSNRHRLSPRAVGASRFGKDKTKMTATGEER
jgi:hypothetical protein